MASNSSFVGALQQPCSRSEVCAVRAKGKKGYRGRKRSFRP